MRKALRASRAPWAALPVVVPVPVPVPVPVVPVVVPVPVVGGVTRSVCLELPQGPAEGSAGAHGIAALEAPVDLERQVVYQARRLPDHNRHREHRKSPGLRPSASKTRATLKNRLQDKQEKKSSITMASRGRESSR